MRVRLYCIGYKSMTDGAMSWTSVSARNTQQATERAYRFRKPGEMIWLVLAY